MEEYYYKEQELQAFHEKHFAKYHFLKRSLKLVLSVSIFSLILCCYSGFSFFPHSFNVYFSTFLFSFFTHTLERKYMFLICNGILAFLAKSSVSCSTSSSSSCASVVGEVSASELPEVMKETANVNEGVHHLAIIESSENVALDEAQDEEPEQKEKQEAQVKGSLIGEAEDKESIEVLPPQDYYYSDEDEDEDEESVTVQEEDQDNMGELAEEARAAAINEPSTDELNKRIEEFIRKMKEEIRIEAQQQLIAV